MESRLRLSSDSSDAIRLTEFAHTFCSRQGLPDAECSRLLVILDELFTNTISYGYQETTGGGQIEISLSLDGDRLVVEFSDDGTPFDPLNSDPPDLDLPLEERPIGGIGIALVRALVDEIGYRREDSRNRLTLRRRIARPP